MIQSYQTEQHQMQLSESLKFMQMKHLIRIEKCTMKAVYRLFIPLKLKTNLLLLFSLKKVSEFFLYRYFTKCNRR